MHRSGVSHTWPQTHHNRRPILTFPKGQPILTFPKGQPILTFPKGQPILTFPKGRNWLLRLNVISPHLTSPVGEGLIHQDIDSPSTYRVTCISPTGENERGLK